MNTQDFSSHRQEIVSTEATHIRLAALINLVVVILTVVAQFFRRADLLIWVPLLAISEVGVIIHMEILVHRKGGWLRAQGDPWEMALAANSRSKIFIPISNALMMLPLLVCIIYAWNNYPVNRWPFVISTSVLIGTAIAIWAVAGSSSAKGFTNSNS